MTTTNNKYTVKSIKGSMTVEGTAADAVRAAYAHDVEYQPAYGTTIEISRGEIAGWEVLSLNDANEAIRELREEAVEHGDYAQVRLCDAALEGDCDDSHRIRVLAQIVETHVDAVLA